jgi:hypothetical protein
MTPRGDVGGAWRRYAGEVLSCLDSLGFPPRHAVGILAEIAGGRDPGLALAVLERVGRWRLREAVPLVEALQRRDDLGPVVAEEARRLLLDLDAGEEGAAGRPTRRRSSRGHPGR